MSIYQYIGLHPCKLFVRYLLWLVLFANAINAEGKSPVVYSIKGTVRNSSGEAVAHIHLYEENSMRHTVSLLDGSYLLQVPAGKMVLKVGGMGYASIDISLQIIADTVLDIRLTEGRERLDAAKVVGSEQAKYKRQATSVVSENSANMANRAGGSLMKSLSHLPGVGAIEIGQGLSKPVIRGLSFNRVAVSESGIKQQGQQWGADHGLEIDQFNVDRVDVIKGPLSLQYGSDAIGGILLIKPLQLDTVDGWLSTVMINAKSNNQLIGGSWGVGYQKNNRFIRFRASIQDFADYKVPADSFNYLSYRFPLHKRLLKNTAGAERDVYLSGGFTYQQLTTSVAISNVYAKMGFFAGAHGIPSVSNLADDGHRRNIDLPYQSVNHFKVISNSKLVHRNITWKLDLAYQYNLRQEYATPHTHGTRPLPDNTKEIELRLQTMSANLNADLPLSDQHTLYWGFTSERQQNKIAGYSFLLPQFEQLSLGAFALSRLKINPQLTLTSGVRADWGQLNIHQYIDPYIGANGFERTPQLDKHFSDISFGIGLNYLINQQITARANIGKSFRLPTANELASNGVHHGTYRYEVGDPNILPETAYQLDLGIDFEWNEVSLFDQIGLKMSGFSSIFPNFIFLHPTGDYSVTGNDGESILLPDVGQIYRYEQAKALRTGGEALLSLVLNKSWDLESAVEYVYAKDLDRQYPIPFTPPLKWRSDLNYHLAKFIGKSQLGISVGHQYSASQMRVRNEETTAGYTVWDFRMNWQWQKSVRLVVQVQNVFDTRYFNHTSYYRSLELPEMGRNITLSWHYTIN